jgi:hypothetical protein
MKKASYFIKYRKRLLPLAVIIPLLAALSMSSPALAAPVVTLDPAFGAAGTRISITGTVFDSYNGDDIFLFFDDDEIDGSPAVPQDGTFSIQFIVPFDIEPGRHWIEARSETTSTSMLAKNFFILEETGVVLDIYEGPVGTEVVISGSGFYVGRALNMYYSNITVDKIGTVTASPVGRFTYDFTIPPSPGGIHIISAANDEGDSAEIEFEVIPVINLNLDAAGPGDLLNIGGTGFGSRTDVAISFGVYKSAVARTDDYGSFDITFNVPRVKPGQYDITAKDNEGNVDVGIFTVTAGVSLSSTDGPVGSKVTVIGSGFEAGQAVTVDYDDLRVAIDTADNNGDFSTTFDIPPSKSGSHVVTISDGTTTKLIAFTVESDPPDTPDALMPSNGSVTRAEAYLDWHDVTDTSLPVVYSLQIASDQNFSSLVLGKEGLAISEYTLSGEEKLLAVAQQVTYYWRVKAIDSAGNESEWSLPWKFYVNPPPVPLLLQPAPDSRAEEPVKFDWQTVTSLSEPVTYNLQVATDLNFTTIFLEENGLVDSGYLLEEEEDELELEREITYYWRVKAVDGAGNESEWSTPGSFYIEPSFSFPGWATYTLIGIVGIFIIFLAFRFGRRTAYQPPE